jgi:hypothetical protein
MEHSSTTIPHSRITTTTDSATAHAVDNLRQYGTVAFFVATLVIGVFTVFGDSIQSLMHSL